MKNVFKNEQNMRLGFKIEFGLLILLPNEIFLTNHQTN